MTSERGDAVARLQELSDRELLELSGACVEELRERGVVRTGNAPLGDYAEWLAAKAFSGELAPNSERSYDLTTGAGIRIQVKARRVSDPPKPGQLQTSPFRSWGFDQALLMLVDERTYEVRRASLVPQPVVEELSRYVSSCQRLERLHDRGPDGSCRSRRRHWASPGSSGRRSGERDYRTPSDPAACSAASS